MGQYSLYENMIKARIVNMPCSLLFSLGKITIVWQQKQVKNSQFVERNRHDNYHPVKGKNAIVSSSDKLLSVQPHFSANTQSVWMHTEYCDSMSVTS